MTAHVGDVARDPTRLGGWLASCACGWTASNPYPDAQAAALAVGDHVLHRQETTP